jgi:uncharacterized membrane protein YeaQ/YmgE (transglycosylase-associated protein family)
MITYLILLALSGLIVGALARLALPGRDPMSIPATIAVGLAGSLIAGLIAYAIFGDPTVGGFLLAQVCAIAIVYAVRRSRGGSLMRPAEPRD